MMLGLTAVTASAADQFDVVTLQSNTSSQTVWRITQPNVKQASTAYPQIKFLPGDSVSVDAGGCVQTGGSGSTWKLYVNPSGPNSDRLYHGKIWIPGIDNSLTRIKDFTAFKAARGIASPLPAGLNPADMYLRLGYEDDGYGDNGYYSHDDGTQNQCKNSVNAFVIISIGHNGTLAADPAQFVGISPANFRCQAAWAFHNFNTSQLSKSSFNNAFNLKWYDYLDPTVEITFLAARGIASSGNCAGMSLLADVGEDQFVVGQLDESFWANYKSTSVSSPSVATDINTAHWKQLSVAFLRGYLGTVFQSPSKTASAIEQDLTKANSNYGLLSIAHGSGGHVLVPLAVSHAGNQTLIDVYDSNRPCGSIPDNTQYPKVVITGNSWSYNMGSEGTWTGSTNGTAGYTGLAYVPYLGDDGWSSLGTSLTGLVQVIFGNGVNVEQVTDNTGKRLFVQNQPNVIDTSAQGLGSSLVRIPLLAANTKRPRVTGSTFPLNLELKLTPAMAAQVQQLQTEYEADYGGSGQIFVATSKQLASLTFTLSGGKASQPARMLVGQNGEFYEIKSASTGNSLAHPTLTIHNLGSMADGVSVQSADQAPLKISVAHGLVSAQANTVMIEKTADMAISKAPAKFSVAADKKLQLTSAEAIGQVNVSTQLFDQTAKMTNAPVRVMAPVKPR
jgi:hypothetical protein